MHVPMYIKNLLWYLVHAFYVVVLCVCEMHMVKGIMIYQNTFELGNGPL